MGGNERERRPAVSESVLVDLEEQERGEETAVTSLEIELPQELVFWWEMERSAEIFDERLLWDDLSHEGKRTLRKLLG